MKPCAANKGSKVSRANKVSVGNRASPANRVSLGSKGNLGKGAKGSKAKWDWASRVKNNKAKTRRGVAAKAGMVKMAKHWLGGRTRSAERSAK